MTDYGQQDADATTQLRVIRETPRQPEQQPFPDPSPFPEASSPFPGAAPGRPADPFADPYADLYAPEPTARRSSRRMPLIVSGVIGLVLVLGAVGYALYDGTPQAKPSTIGASSAPAPAPQPIPTSASQSKYVTSMIKVDQFFGLDPVRTAKQGKAICNYLMVGPTRAEALAYAQKRLTGGTFTLPEDKVVKAIGNGRTYLCPNAPIAR